LLTGRLIAVGLNFGAQVLIARYLSKNEYGAFLYALSFVGLCQAFATLGFKRGISRFVPIYHERREYEKLFGTVFLAVGTVLVMGLAIISTVYFWPQLLSSFLADEKATYLLLSILIFLVPVEALDLVFIYLLASFGQAKAIFFRKHILGPGLKFLVVLLLIEFESEVMLLAYGYLLAGALGLSISFWVLSGSFRRLGLWQGLSLKTIQFPVREILAFTLPVLSSDLLNVVMNSVNVLMLGFFHGTSEVAQFRVVLPAARLNTIVMASLAMLYTPSVARLFARKDSSGINHLYWKTAAWTAVLSFPIFATTFCMAKPLTTFLYGARYESAAPILALLSVGYYFNASLGHNGLTLKVLGKVRYTLTIDLIAILINLVANLFLIRSYGALGAAIGTAGTMIVHNILKQAGLRLASGLNIFDWSYVSFYLIIVGSVLALVVTQLLTPENIYLAIALVICATLFVFAATRKKLDIAKTFPELLRIPLFRLILT